MATIRFAPGEYLRDRDIIKETGEFAIRYGRNALVIGGLRAIEAVRDSLTSSLKRVGMQFDIDYFKGFCSQSNIAKYREKLKGYDMLIAAGGGRVMDCAKAASYAANKPLITIPTIVATCASWTPLSVVYTDEGVYESILEYPTTPKAILVDLEVLRRAPERYLASGIADSLAKWHEISLNIGCLKRCEIPVIISLNLADLSYKTLLDKGLAAVEANHNHEITAEFEDIVDTVVLLIGIISGLAGEATRLAVGHTIYNNLSYFRVADSYLHGEKVAFGLAVQQVLQGKSEEEVISFLKYLRSLKIPTTLAGFGINKYQQRSQLFDLLAAEDSLIKAPFDGSRKRIEQAFLKVDYLSERMPEETL